MTADNWMPGQPRPPYLDGSAPGLVYMLQFSIFFKFKIMLLMIFFVLYIIILQYNKIFLNYIQV